MWKLEFLTVYEATIATALCHMAREGYGVAWVPLSIVTAELENGQLVRAGDKKDNVDLHIKIYRNTNIIAPHAEKFWQVLLQSDLSSSDRI